MEIQSTFSEEFKEVVRKKATDLISSNQEKGELEDDFYGPLMIFIDKRPKTILFSAKIDDHQIYVGGEQE